MIQKERCEWQNKKRKKEKKKKKKLAEKSRGSVERDIRPRQPFVWAGTVSALVRKHRSVSETKLEKAFCTRWTIDTPRRS
jgi:hypothetical protein